MQALRDTIINVLGLEGVERGDELDIPCPVHADRKPSAGVNLETGMWHCFSCGAGGDIVGLAMAVRGLDFPAAKRLVDPQSPEALVSKLTQIAKAALGWQPKPAPLPGPYPFERMEYLYGRGYTEETLRKYGAGYVEREDFVTARGPYAIAHHVALPIRAASGHLQAYVYRNTAPGPLRYLYTPGTPLSTLWFGVHLYPRGGDIVVTEGALDSMWVSQCGHPAIAALGSNASHKLAQLTRYNRVILFMDRDAAGVHAAEGIGSVLSRKMPVLVARYPRKSSAKDPAELSPSQVSAAIAKAVAYLEWHTIGDI